MASRAEDTNGDKILKCQNTPSFLDLSFQQGSEVFLDIFYDSNSDTAAAVIYSGSTGESVLYDFNESLRVNFDFKLSTGFLSWKNQSTKAYLSLVYLGNQWGMAGQIPGDHKNNDWADKEIELMCSETESFSKHFD